MNRKILIKAIEDKYLFPAYVLYALCMIAIISTPFVWLWHSWYFAWRILITSLLVFIFLNVYIYFGGKIIEKVVDDFLNKNPHLLKKSSFQKRMEEIINKNKN